jgi:HEAT repeats
MRTIQLGMACAAHHRHVSVDRPTVRGTDAHGHSPVAAVLKLAEDMVSPLPASTRRRLALATVVWLTLARPVAAAPKFFTVRQPEPRGSPYPSRPADEMFRGTERQVLGFLALDRRSVSMDTLAMVHASDKGGRVVFADVSIPNVRAVVAQVLGAPAPGGAPPSGKRTSQAGPAWLVVARAGRLTVRVDGAPLRAVLDEIVRQTGVTISGTASLEEPVSEIFNDLPLEVGLRWLLRSRNAVLVYTPSREPSVPGVLLEVRIFPGFARVSERPGLSSVAGLAASENELLGRLVDALETADPSGRVAAAVRLGESGETAAAAPLVKGLTDGSPLVRRAAADALGQLSLLTGPDETVTNALVEMATGERDREIRQAAVKALRHVANLWAHRGATAGLQQALLDTDADVRALARQSLDELHAIQ